MSGQPPRRPRGIIVLGRGYQVLGALSAFSMLGVPMGAGLGDLSVPQATTVVVMFGVLALLLFSIGTGLLSSTRWAFDVCVLVAAVGLAGWLYALITVPKARGVSVIWVTSTAAALLYMLRPAFRVEVARSWHGRHLYSILTRARDRAEGGGGS